MNSKPTIMLVLIATCALTGCKVDQWSPFEPDWTTVHEHEAKRDARLPVATANIDKRGNEQDGEAGPAGGSISDVNGVADVANGLIELSLEQAVMLAITNNRDLAVERLQPTIDGAFELIERGRFDPQLYAELAYEETVASETARSTGQQFSVESEAIESQVGLRQDLPTGTSVDLEVTQTRDVSNRAPEQQEARVGLTVTQSLLRGLGPAVNLASVRQAQLDTKASMHELAGFIETLVARTEIAYWNYVLAQREIEIYQRSLDVAQSQLEQVQQRIEVGVLSPVDAAAFRSEVASRNQALIDGQAASDEARLRLLRLINLSIDVPLDSDLQTTTAANVEPKAIDDLPQRIGLAVTARHDLAQARLLHEQDRLETVVTRNGLMPRLDAFVSLGRSGFAGEFVQSFANLGEDTYDARIGVQFSMPINNRAARGRDIQARATRRQSAAAVANLEQFVRLDVRLAANELSRARKQITASAQTRELQEKTTQAEQEKFDVGTGTSLLVAQAQRDLLAAQIREVEAIVAYRIARIELYLAEGSLLDRRGLTVAQTDH